MCLEADDYLQLLMTAREVCYENVWENISEQ